jgi:hypothetical protein
MKSITIAIAVLALFAVHPAHADTFEFSWQSQAWSRVYEGPGRASVSGPFTLSGNGTASFAELAGGLASFQFDGGHGGTLVANGDGSFNGPMSFRTATDETRNGLGVLTPTADGFTVRVQRAASGPDAGATFVGAGTRLAGGAGPTVSASEPLTAVLAAAGLVAAVWASRRRGV